MATNPSTIASWYDTYLQSKPKAATYVPTAATATEWKPDEQSTVQGQLGGMLAKGSPLMDRAETQALQQANKRGLLNSSMAVTAGQSALYDAALPIAQQDAQTFGAAGRFNADAKNSTSQFNANATNRAGEFNAGSENDMTGLLFGAAKDFSLQDRAQTFTAGQSALDRDWRTGERTAGQEFTTGRDTAMFDRELAKLDKDQQFIVQRDAANFDRQIQLAGLANAETLSAQYRVYAGSALTSYNQQITAIQQSDMDPDVKQAQIEAAAQLYTQSMAFVNTLFTSAPNWKAEWATVIAEMEG